LMILSRAAWLTLLSLLIANRSSRSNDLK
jgi:hypothetical protein